MRFAVACTLALLLAPSIASSTEAEPRDALAVSIYTGEEFGAIATWTPAPNALGYAVHRGTSIETATYVGETVGTMWHDEAPLPGDSWYVIYSISPQGGGPLGELGGFRGSCVSQRGATGVTVTASHCVPSDPF